MYVCVCIYMDKMKPVSNTIKETIHVCVRSVSSFVPSHFTSKIPNEGVRRGGVVCKAIR